MTYGGSTYGDAYYGSTSFTLLDFNFDGQSEASLSVQTQRIRDFTFDGDSVADFTTSIERIRDLSFDGDSEGNFALVLDRYSVFITESSVIGVDNSTSEIIGVVGRED